MKCVSTEHATMLANRSGNYTLWGKSPNSYRDKILLKTAPIK